MKKHIIRALAHDLLNHNEAPRMHKPHECHLEGSWEHLGASCGLSGALYGLVGASRALMHGSLLAFEMLWVK